MNAFVELVVEPSLTRNSLILIALAFRIFPAADSECFAALAAFVHDTVPTRSPLKADEPEVIVNAALTLAPGATGSANAADLFVVPETTEVHCLGADTLSTTLVAGAPVVFVKVSVASCDDPGANVCSPGGAAIAEVGARLSRGTSYPAATTLACTNWSVASDGKVPAAVIAPS